MEDRAREKALAALKDELEATAREAHWPPAERAGAIALLTGLARDPLRFEDMSVLAPELLRDFATTADPPMALRNWLRYAYAVVDMGTHLRLLRQSPDLRRLFGRLFAFSQFFADIVVRNPEYLDSVLASEYLDREKPLSVLREEVTRALRPFRSLDAKRRALSRIKRRETLRLGLRDMTGRGGVLSAARELSQLAQVACEVALEVCRGELEARFGQPEDAPPGDDFLVVAMGKFGGEELNFSSDIDLVFVYRSEGTTSGKGDASGHVGGRIRNHEFYGRLATDICRFLGDATTEGTLYRVDARLRPEGDSGPMARSLASYESYLAEQARAWERVAYLKARSVAGGEGTLGREFDALTRAFVFGPSNPGTLLAEIARLKRRIDTERLDAEGRGRDIKRGTGGIREVEFVVTALQILHGGANPELRVRPTVQALARLRDAGHLPPEDEAALREAYIFYRAVEHRLQMLNDQQTHALPEAPSERRALGLRCGAPSVEEFETILDGHRRAVREHFNSLFQEAASERETLLELLTGTGGPDPATLSELEPYGLGTSVGFEALRDLATGGSEIAVSRRGQRSFETLLPILLETLQFAAEPLEAVRHLSSVLRRGGSMVSTFDFFLAHRSILRLLLQTLGFGQYPARELVAHPELLEEMLAAGALNPGRPLPDLFQIEVTRLLEGGTEEEALAAIRRFKSREAFFLAAKDIMGIETVEEAADGMTLLADVVFQGVLRVAERTRPPDLPPWVIMGMGGYGAGRVHLHGDLDVAVFFEDGGPEAASKVSQLAAWCLSAMPAVSPQGQLWKVDARLRPDGLNAPLAVSLERAGRYWREEAGIWELQSAMRLRPVAGDFALGERVLRAIRAGVEARTPMPRLAEEILSMRARQEAAHKAPRRSPFDVKQSPGGMIDVEFLTQFFQLRHGLDHPDLLATPRSRTLLELAGRHGWLSPEDARFAAYHWKSLRRLQRTVRLLFETAKDAFPPQPERAEVLRRALHGQEPDISPILDEFPDRMKRMRSIFDTALRDLR